MRKICIINRKGGVGKTTTAVSLAAGLSRHDKKVLLVDLDPQSSVHLSLKVKSEHELQEAIMGQVTIQKCIETVAKNFDVITSTEALAGMEYQLTGQGEQKLVLADILDDVSGYDYLIVDSPASMGMINQNVLVYCDEAFIPTTSDYMGYQALHKMIELINNANEHFQSNTKITKIIPTMFDKRNKICKETLMQMQTEFPELTGYPVRLNSKVKEAPKEGKSIFKYAKSSSGAKDYARLVEDVLMMERSSRSPDAASAESAIQLV